MIFNLSIPERLRGAVFGALVLGMALRVAALVVSANYPIALPGHPEDVVSPLVVGGIDNSYYASTKDRLRTAFGQDSLSAWYQAYTYSPFPFPGSFGRKFVPPFLPAAMLVFGYEGSNALPMALAWSAVSAALLAVSLIFLAGNGIGIWGLLLFAAMPHPIFYALAVGTDLPFALASLLFIFAYAAGPGPSRTAMWLTLGIAAATIRANSVSLLGFAIADMIWLWYWQGERRPREIVVGALLATGLVALYANTFSVYVNDAGYRDQGSAFFGAQQADYVAGIFPSLPDFPNRALSLAALIAAKLLYLTGLRPPFEEQVSIFTWARALPGLILFPGLVLAMFRGDARMKLLVAALVAPPLAGLAQERYILPLLPILFLYGARFWDGVISRLGAQLRRSDPEYRVRDRGASAG